MATTPSRTSQRCPEPVEGTLTRDIDPDLPGAGRKVSYEEFFEWAPDSRIAEWVDGEIIMPSPPRFGHQDISDFLTAVLRIYTQAFELGQVISAPFQVKPGAGLPGREPDILFVAAPHELEQDTPRLERAPDVAIEIVSPGTIGTDREEKYLEYAAVGVREYWLLNGLEYTAEFYRLNAAGVYDSVFAGGAGVYRSEVIDGFALEVGWLWEVPRPRPELAVLEMAGARYAQEVLVVAAEVLPAGELASALPDVLTVLPSDMVAQALPDVLTALPPDVVAQALPDVLTALPPDVVAQALPDVLTALPPDVVAQALPDVLTALPPDVVAQALPDVLTALPPDTVAQALPDVLTALPLDLLVDTLAALGQSLPPSERAKLRDALS
ncbi:MAG: Uma2 family endonuclease [Anaerolineae bacterium]